ncbi:T9SS type A sorting domain-containing protein [Flavobacterium sp. RHBU_3]|uniref:DUF7619 domain-containing protein n=1 Tax=Flavobacterium sp. RHBU_3 TaxID=3391184 RepID=UPI003984C944
MRKLLLSLLLLIGMHAFAQVQAFQPNDIYTCVLQAVDLTQQEAVIIGDQDITQVYISGYYETEGDAQMAVNAIGDSSYYTPIMGNEAHIFVRVNSATSQFDYAITSFFVYASAASYNHPDVFSCGSYILEALPEGLNYYTPSFDWGVYLPVGTEITNSISINIFGEYEGCTVNDYFSVYMGLENFISTGVSSCSSYTIPVIPFGSFYTLPGGPNTPGNVQRVSGDEITETTQLYVYYESNGCTDEQEYLVTIADMDEILPLQSLEACQTYPESGLGVFNLETAVAEYNAINPEGAVLSFYFTEANAQAGVNQIYNIAQVVNTVPNNQTIYLRYQYYQSCWGTMPIELNVIDCGTATDELYGTITFDDEGDGCDSNDIPFANVQVGYTVGSFTFYTFTDSDGQYSFVGVPPGMATVSVVGEELLTDPLSVVVSMPTIDNSENNFCISFAEQFTDVTAFATFGQAVPGFNAICHVYVTNNGTQTASGTLSFTFNDGYLTPLTTNNAVQNGNVLTWNYSDLLPYQNISFTVIFQVAQPPLVNSGTQLTYTAIATTTNTDSNEANNTFTGVRTVTNSFDPNDITVSEGEYITEAQADGYLHYTIRFQNTGTANAQMVKVSLPLDEKLDWSTFQPIGASHTYQANRQEGAVEFLFNDIQLAYESADEPASHGFVSFRIKPVANAQVGDSMSETAAIYFDFNEAIVTNTVTTTITSAAAVANNKDKVFSLYPNPASDRVILKLNGAEVAQVKITDVLGKTLYSDSVLDNGSINVSQLPAGIYMVTVQSGNATQTGKLIKK